MQTILIIFAGLCIGVYLLAFVYFALVKPDYLRSESYHIQKQSIDILGTKSAQLETSAEDIVRIANPQRDES